jgi:hypothetical protein
VCRAEGSGVPVGSGLRSAITVRGVLHPVGKLPAAVYWRRRLTVLALVLVVLGGAGWLGVVLLTGGDAGGTTAAAAAGSARPSAPLPALERVVPSLSSVSTPTPPAARAAEPVPVTPPAPAPGDPCSDDMISLEVATPPTVSVGTKPTFELVVANTSAVPCSRTLDKGLQEIVLLDSEGGRIWGSNDCFPEASTDTRTLAAGEVVTFPLVWGGLTSEPTCTAARSNPAPGSYVLRGRLDTKVSADVPLTLD